MVVVHYVVLCVEVVMEVGRRFIDDEDEDLMENSVRRSYSLTSEVAREEGVVVVAEGALATTFTELLGKEVARVAAVVAEGEGREVAEVVKGDGITVVRMAREVEQGDAMAVARLVMGVVGEACTMVLLTAR